MFWLQLVDNTELFFLVFARVMALIMTAPLVSSEAVPAIAKVGLGFFGSLGVFPWVKTLGLAVSETGLGYVALLMGEIFIGLIIGFFLQIVYAAFQTAGQFFSVQAGFGISEVFDPLSQEELPVIGQFFNLIAMFVFLSVSGFVKLFLYGVFGSFQALNTVDIVNAHARFLQYFVGGLGKLFQEALTLAFPVLGALFVVSVAMGLMAKAAPQLNLMSLGFPLNLMVAFGLMVLVLPLLINAFSGIIDNSFSSLAVMMRDIGGQVPESVTNALTPPSPGAGQ